jgi:hypothetical protein
MGYPTAKFLLDRWRPHIGEEILGGTNMAAPFGLLSVAEQATVLAEAMPMTKSEQAKFFGLSERIWFGHRRGEVSQAAAAQKIADQYRGSMFVFWSTAADKAVAAIREASDVLSMRDMLDLHYRAQVDELLAIDPEAVDLNALDAMEEDATLDYFGRTYSLAFYLSRLGRVRNAVVNRSQVLEDYLLLVDKLEQYLAGLPEDEPSVRALRFRIGWDRFMMKFETLSSDEKAGPEWSAELDRNQFFETVLEYNERIPCAWQYSWNALAFASMLEREELYAPLISRLLASKKFKDHEAIMAHPSFDSDFSNVVPWLRVQIAAE